MPASSDGTSGKACAGGEGCVSDSWYAMVPSIFGDANFNTVDQAFDVDQAMTLLVAMRREKVTWDEAKSWLWSCLGDHRPMNPQPHWKNIEAHFRPWLEHRPA